MMCSLSTGSSSNWTDLGRGDCAAKMLGEAGRDVAGVTVRGEMSPSLPPSRPSTCFVSSVIASFATDTWTYQCARKQHEVHLHFQGSEGHCFAAQHMRLVGGERSHWGLVDMGGRKGRLEEVWDPSLDHM